MEKLTDVQPELKPCPFCGGEACYEYGPGAYGRNENERFGWIQCRNCHVTTDARINEKAAAAAWNRRAEPEKRTWTSVKDALPPKEGEYLTIHESGEILELHYDPMMEAGKCFGKIESYYDMDTLGWAGSEWMPVYGITHWMELLELPEEYRK